jgi:hypothetical protein
VLRKSYYVTLVITPGVDKHEFALLALSKEGNDASARTEATSVRQCAGA